MAYWFQTPDSTGVWFRDQSDFVTAAATGTESSWTKLVCEFDLPGIADKSIDLVDAVGQAGASAAILAGPEDGITFKIKGQLRSQAEAWAGTDAIASSPEVELLGDFIGGGVSARNYQASSVTTGSDANTVVLASGTFVDGQFVNFGASASTVDVRGWCKTAATLELNEDAESVAVSGDHGYGSVTIAPAVTQPTAKTFRILGGTAWQDIRLIGCIPHQATITMGTGEVPTWEIEYTATQLQWNGSAGDDLVPAPTYNQIEAFTGTNNGRVTVNLISTSDGNVDAGDIYCDVANINVVITRAAARIECPSSLEGVSNVNLGAPKIMMTATVPVKDTDVSGGSGGKTIWDGRYTDQTKFSFSAYLGHTAGRMMALQIPAARLSKRPTIMKIAGDVIGHNLEMTPGPYTDSTAAVGDTPFRVAVA